MRFELQGEACATRFRYSKVVCDSLRYVIVDASAGGALEFWSQEPGEVRWFRFDPAPDERDAALTLWRSGGGCGVGWPLLLP